MTGAPGEMLSWGSHDDDDDDVDETNCTIAHILGILLMISYWFVFSFGDIIVAKNKS